MDFLVPDQGVLRLENPVISSGKYTRRAGTPFDFSTP
jgi:hypothetical protein